MIEDEKLVQVKETEYTITMLSRTEIHNHYTMFDINTRTALVSKGKREIPHATTDYNCC